MTPWSFRVLEVVRVVDGDTLDVLVDMGFRVQCTQRLRLLGLDTPERGKPGYIGARDDLTKWTVDNAPLVTLVFKGDSFGRWLVDLRPAAGGESCSDWMVGRGWPVYSELR